MDSISNLKLRSKKVLSGSYWKALLVSFIAAVANGQCKGNGSGINYDNDISIAETFTGKTFQNIESFFAEFWGLILVIGLFVILFFIIISYVMKAFLGNPVLVSANKYYIEASKGNFDLKYISFCFNKSYLNIVLTMFLKDLYVFLWSLLLIIPGIVKAYSYSMVGYILAENPATDHKSARDKSESLMMGNKGRLFLLDLSFIGWYLLGFILLFIGAFFVVPYHTATRIEFFNDLYHDRQSSSSYELNGETISY